MYGPRNVGHGKRDGGPRHSCLDCFPPTQEKVEALLKRIHLFKIERINFREAQAKRRTALDARIATQRAADERDIAFEESSNGSSWRRQWEAATKPRPIRRRTHTAEQERRARIAEENLHLRPDPMTWKA